MNLSYILILQYYKIIKLNIRQMWQSKKLTNFPKKQKPNPHNFTHAQPQQKNKNYPSKLISQLMNSDSQNQQQLFPTLDNNIDLLPPPLVTVSKAQKQNININYNMPSYPKNPKQNRSTLQNQNQNKANTQIKYLYHKLQDSRQIDSSPYTNTNTNTNNNKHFNSINLQQASIIPEYNPNDLIILQLQNQYQKIKQQNVQFAKMHHSMQNQNKSLKRQINLLKQQIQTKDNVYEQLEQKLMHQSKEKEGLERKISDLEFRIQELKEQSRSREYSSKRRRGGGGQLSKYIQNMTNPKNTQQNQTKRHPHPQSLHTQKQNTYKQITNYLIKSIQQLKNKLIQRRMSANVEQILQEFMTQIVNINQITVSRALGKGKNGNQYVSISNSTRSAHKVVYNQYNTSNSIVGTNTLFTRNSLFREMPKIQSSVTPQKPQPRQKTQQLRNLQKSLNKLKQMQKSFINSTPYAGKDKQSNDYSSLDRSSIIGLDKSNRSKSRRKKIFE